MNVSGIGERVKRRQIFKYLKEKNTDIACIQETHASKSKHKIWNAEWGGTIVYSDGCDKAKGVAILFHKKLGILHDDIKIHKDSNGRYLQVEFALNTKKICLINMYAPNTDNPEYFVEAFAGIEQIEADYLMIMGDLNIWLNPELDRKSVVHNRVKSKSVTIVNTFLEESNWLDIWRFRNPDKFAFTYKKVKPKLTMTRLDYFLAPVSTTLAVNTCQILPSYLSDHNPIFLQLVTDENIKGKGLWKFNTQHLKNLHYVKSINDILQKANVKYTDLNPILRWEVVKDEIMTFSKSYSTTKAHECKAKKEQLEQKLRTCQKRLAMINLKSDQAVAIITKVNGKIDEIERELRKISLLNTQGAMVRSKAQYYVEGEHCTKYFFELEKRNARSKTMTAAKNEKNETVYNSAEILKVQARYFEKLYQVDREVDCRLEGDPPQKVSNEDYAELEKLITMDELKHAVKSMARGKTPGSSGMQVDFYIVFWKDIADLLFQAFVHALSNGKMSYLQRQGIISLIPKKDCDILYVKNWRPIVLLNTDYKILSKVFANRIKTVLQKIIHKNQSGFLKGRHITENLRTILDVVDYANIENVPAVLISVDFEKAFDKVRYLALRSTLEWFGFGPNFINAIDTLFNDFRLATINNGYLSPFITPQKGLFQGNPIASYLFICVIEVLAINLRKNNKIQGVQLSIEQILLSLFADDLALLMKFDQESWQQITYEFNKFISLTGMTINYNKSTVYRLGSLRHTNAKFYSKNKLQWTNDPIKLLGIYITADHDELMSSNLDPLLDKTQVIL